MGWVRTQSMTIPVAWASAASASSMAAASVVRSDSAGVATAVGLARWRRWLTWGLGAIWLLDAALQFQPYMFTKAFPKQVIAPTGLGSPVWIQGPVTWSAHLMEQHIVLTNALFATVQLVIAVGMFSRRTVRAALVASVVWAVLVWWLGEGLGGLFAGPVMPIMGLPGAVIIYAVIAVLVWPRDGREDEKMPARSVAAASPLGKWGSRAVSVALWGLFVAESLRPAEPQAVSVTRRCVRDG